ncbi:hypothetical protein Enr13x_57670 [Stieleria neptunia]|uniref:Uncharacterized protein n=1 Tax=Stieleria neptunia TaxID=2527979 RepID=A0A518HYK5_9BACT|nr:hypothetical protein Enr13x_57670 [Stieleria neptunia]
MSLPVARQTGRFGRQGEGETRRQGDKETRRQGERETRREGEDASCENLATSIVLPLHRSAIPPFCHPINIRGDALPSVGSSFSIGESNLPRLASHDRHLGCSHIEFCINQLPDRLLADGHRFDGSDRESLSSDRFLVCYVSEPMTPTARWKF